MIDKQALHQLIDDLDEERVERASVILTELMSDGTGSNQNGMSDEERLADAKPLQPDDPFWKWVGSGYSDPAGPNDIAENHDKYLAEIYADLHDK